MECGVFSPNVIGLRFLNDINTAARRFLLAVGLIDFTTSTQFLFSPVLDEL